MLNRAVLGSDAPASGTSRVLDAVCCSVCARSSTDRASDYGSEGWGFESLRARPAHRPSARLAKGFSVPVGATLGATGARQPNSARLTDHQPGRASRRNITVLDLLHTVGHSQPPRSPGGWPCPVKGARRGALDGSVSVGSPCTTQVRRASGTMAGTAAGAGPERADDHRGSVDGPGTTQVR